MFCITHDLPVETTFYNYERCKTGLKCCGKKQVSTKLTDRKFSDTTLKKMSISALNRIKRGGKPRGWRKNPRYSKWRSKVMVIFNNNCAITGLKATQVKVNVHHLYGVKKYPNLKYVAENGIVLEKSLHVQFHKIYGYHNNNIDQFKSFLLLLLETKKQTYANQQPS